MFDYNFGKETLNSYEGNIDSNVEKKENENDS